MEREGLCGLNEERLKKQLDEIAILKTDLDINADKQQQKHGELEMRGQQLAEAEQRATERVEMAAEQERLLMQIQEQLKKEEASAVESSFKTSSGLIFKKKRKMDLGDSDMDSNNKGSHSSPVALVA